MLLRCPLDSGEFIRHHTLILLSYFPTVAGVAAESLPFLNWDPEI